MNNKLSQFNLIQDFLFSLRNAGSKYSLDRISAFCSALGNPQNFYPKIHVAGTNGKGSVCAMLERILRNSFDNVGMFTSPHLTYLGERVQINRIPIQKGELADYAANLRKIADSIFNPHDLPAYPSFFEFMTALAFLYFRKKNADCAVIEVGLGGRLDSTNIVTPEISVITSIGLDHIQMLGSSISQIAGEKAGIIKQGVPSYADFFPTRRLRLSRKLPRKKMRPFSRQPIILSPTSFCQKLPFTDITNVATRPRRHCAPKFCVAALSKARHLRRLPSLFPTQCPSP